MKSQVTLSFAGVNGREVSLPSDQVHLDWLEALYSEPTTWSFEAGIGGDIALAERSGNTENLWYVTLESGEGHLILTEHKYSEELILADTGAGPLERPIRLFVPTELLRLGLEALAGAVVEGVEWEDADLWGLVRTPESRDE